MKKIMLLILAFVLMQSACFAADDEFTQAWKDNRITLTHDNFYGTDFFFVHCENESGLFDQAGYWRTALDFTLENNQTKNASPISDRLYIDLQYHSDDIYSLDKKITVKLGDIIIDLPQRTSSSLANQAVEAKYTLTPEFFTALKTFQGDAIFRVYYRTLTGQYYRDITVPTKKVKDIKLLFSLIYPELTAAK